MASKTQKVLATTLALAAGAGLHAGKEMFVRGGIEHGKAVVVAAPLGNCTLREVFVNGEKVFINVSVTSDRENAAPSGLDVITINGDVPVDMGETGKGGPGMSMVGGTIPTSKLVSPVPANAPTPVGAVFAETPDGRAYCGSFTVIPYAGNGNQGQTIG